MTSKLIPKNCNDENEDTKIINAKLLVAAEKYNILWLLEVCSYYLKQNISVENGIDILVSANITNQKAMFDSAASDFIISNHEILIKTSAFGENSRKLTH